MKYLKDSKLLMTILAGFLLAAVIYGAGSVTETSYTPTDVPKFEMHKMVLDWTASTDGEVNDVTTEYAIDGEIYRVITIPDTGATTPSDNYDVYLYDDDSVDVLNGSGVDEPNSEYSQFCPVLYHDSDDANGFGRMAVHGMLQLEVFNAGASNGGKVIIYWR